MLWLLQRNQKGPNVKICSKRRFCKVCKGIYPTTLHGYARRKVNSTWHQSNSEASEEIKYGEVAACASLNTAMEVISLCVVPV